MVLKLDVQIDVSSQINIQNDVLKSLKLLKPNWNQQDVIFKTYSEGFTNALIGVWTEDRSDQILFRIYGEGTDLFIDRNAEKEAMMLLYEYGCGPQLFATFKNGLCYSYIEGTPLTPSSVRQDQIYPAVARELAAIHKIPISDNEAQVFSKLKTFLDLYPDGLTDDQLTRLAEVKINKEYFEDEAKWMRNLIEALDCPVSFCHNDPLLQNIIWNPEKKVAKYIDFEYAFPNYQAFDIADHFAEFAGFALDIDYDLCPDDDFQRKWLRSYLSGFYEKPEESIDENLIDKWQGWTKKFTLLAHLLWSCWAMVQSKHSKIDFNFLEYGIIRTQEYRRLKEELLRQ